jgi:hypothetical protein
MARTPGIVLLAVVTALGGCDALRPPLEPDADEVPRSEILSVTQSRNPPRMPADGRSVDTIRAAIPRRANVRQVTFVTTRGSFERHGSATKIEVRAEHGPAGRLRAEAVLVADTVPGVATVRATVGGFSDFVDIELVPPSDTAATSSPSN